jgi:flagellar basal body rod protein FlgG
MDPLITARYGMMAAEQRFQASAARVAQMGDDDTVDLGKEVVDQIQARNQFTANVHVVRIADEMWRALMDVQARR